MIKLVLQGDWYSAVNEEGYTYYWNTSTNETSWYPPEVETTNADGSDTAAADGSDPAADNSAPAADGSGQAETDASAPVATDGSEISAPATSTLEQPSETLSDTANTDEKKKEVHYFRQNLPFLSIVTIVSKVMRE